MRKGFYLIDLVKYLGIKIDQNLTWRNQINIVATKINRVHACYVVENKTFHGF